MRSLFRILDANLNRAREALRVLEDLARFHADDAEAAAALKEARHRLDAEARPLRRELLAARDSESDVGREGDLPVGAPRRPAEIAAVNFKRAEEALRSTEETAKGWLKRLGWVAHDVRYRLYALEKGMDDPARRLRACRLYVLLDPSVARGSLARAAEAAVRGGAGMLQLRQKPRVDLGLARELRAASGHALFIVNDDPVVALACGADGVHVGKEDLPLSAVRKLGLPIVGATTHSLAEARRAVKDGADYVSVGPMYATPLKPDLEPRGFEYLGAVRRMGIPYFCIGGITRRTVRPGMGRVAVCAGVIAERDPAEAARTILRRLRKGS